VPYIGFHQYCGYCQSLISIGAVRYKTALCGVLGMTIMVIKILVKPKVCSEERANG
jgi:hypothetical protein